MRRHEKAGKLGRPVASRDPSSVNNAGEAPVDSSFMKLSLAAFVGIRALRREVTLQRLLSRKKFGYPTHPSRFSRLLWVARVGSCVDTAVPVSVFGGFLVQREECRWPLLQSTSLKRLDVAA